MASNSQAKWGTLIDLFSVGILQYRPLPWKQSIPFFSFSWEVQVDQAKHKKCKKKLELNFFIIGVQYYMYRKQNLVLHVKGYHS